MRNASAVITLTPGKGRQRAITVPEIESYMIEQSIDNDADAFSIDIGDTKRRLLASLDRDTEVRVDIFGVDDRGVRRQLFAGLADMAQMQESFTHSIQGRDFPSAIMLDTDAEPGRWRRVKPRPFLTARARKLGIKRVSIASMPEIKVLFTDSTEKEWAFWYRIARTNGLYMWASNNGGIIVDKLGYSPTRFHYYFGVPPRGQLASKWIKVSTVKIGSIKQSRIYQAIGYGDDAKGATVRVGQNIDRRIQGWSRKPVVTFTSTTAKNQKQLNDEAKLEVFESIVGTQEHTLTVRDTGTPIERNRMCKVNLPAYGLVGEFFVVGVTRSASVDGFVQTVRIRERGYAVSKRVPTAPTLEEAGPDILNRPLGSIGTALERSNIPYGASFARAAQEFGVANGWDFSVFLGVLTSIASIESNFRNVREHGSIEWYPKPTVANSIVTDDHSDRMGVPDRGTDAHDRGGENLSNKVITWQRTFANERGAPGNEFSSRGTGDAGVGIMQLTSPGYKRWADEYGWDGKPRFDQYEGGRWNPDSNIRAGARALIEKIKAVGANPAISDTIWAGVRAYNGSGPAADAYVQKVKAEYERFYTTAKTAAESTQRVVPGSALRTIQVPGGPSISLPAQTPQTIAKAITWAFSKYGHPYQWGGTGSRDSQGRDLYDCSSFVTGAYIFADPNLSRIISGPVPGRSHGDTTHTLLANRSLQAVARTALLPGDMIFFHNSNEANGHMGMYVGDDMFIHASSSGGVKVSGLGESYYMTNYSAARRLINWGPRGTLN